MLFPDPSLDPQSDLVQARLPVGNLGAIMEERQKFYIHRQMMLDLMTTVNAVGMHSDIKEDNKPQ
jgi:hypothetical protein